MAEEIKVVVRQESQGTALKDVANDAGRAGTAVAAASQQTEKLLDGGRAIDASDSGAVEKWKWPEFGIVLAPASPWIMRDSGAKADRRRTSCQRKKRGSRRRLKRGGDVDDRTQIKQAAFTTALEAKQARAAGKIDEAVALEREVKIMERSLQLQRTLNFSAAEATVLAHQGGDSGRADRGSEEDECDRRRSESECGKADGRASKGGAQDREGNHR
jgi:hypothetical protein